MPLAPHACTFSCAHVHTFFLHVQVLQKLALENSVTHRFICYAGPLCVNEMVLQEIV